MSKIQDSALKTLVRYKEIVDEHTLDYFLYSGTLLGAIRHDGFIPWDDDIDVGMPRKDYDKLVLILEDALKDDENLSIQIRNKDDRYFAQDFMKIINGDLNICEKVAKTQKQVVGSWVDIFPFDNIPDDESLRNQQLKKIAHYNRLIYIFLLAQPAATDTGIKRLVKASLHTINRVCHRLYFFLPRLFKKKQQWMQMYNDQETAYAADLGYVFYFNEDAIERTRIASADIHNPELKDFEGIEFKVPRNPRIPLATLYGEDYMQLPPESEQVTHTFNEF